MTEAPSDLLRLLALMRTAFARGDRHGGAVAAEAARVAGALPDGQAPAALAAPLQPNDHPCLAELPDALRHAGPAWTDALAPLAGHLPWRFGYAPRADAPGLETRMAWAEIVGPAAPVRHDTVGFGLTFIGRHTFYPPHRHPAVELYTIVAGDAAWTLDGATTTRPPDDFVLHPANAVHAMRTFARPLLAIYSWTGDILSPTAYV